MIINKFIEEDAIQIIEENDYLNELQDKTVMITGASGMIGSYLTYTLVKLNESYKRNVKIILVVRNINKLPNEIRNNENVEIIISDVTNPIKYDNDIDYIIHAASPASPKMMINNPVETNLANTLGTANMLKLAYEKRAKGFLFVSSREIYGQPNDGQKYFTEDGPLGQVNPLVPRNGYAEGKKAAENLCAAYKEEYGLNTKIVRLAHTYGPSMAVDDGRVQADFLNNVIHNQNILLKSDGSSIRTYTYVSDAISGIYRVLLKSNDIVYNIADENNETSIRDLAQTIVDIYPERNLKLIFDIKETAGQNGSAAFTLGILSTEKIRKELGFRSKYNIHDGFKRTIDYLESI